MIRRLRLVQRLLMVTTEVGGEELLCLGNGDVELGLDVDPDVEGSGVHVEQMAADLPIRGDEVEVIAGDIDRPGIERGPEPDQGALLLKDGELALVGGGLEQVLPGFGGTGGSQRQSLEAAIDPDPDEQVLRGSCRVQEFCEIGQ